MERNNDFIHMGTNSGTLDFMYRPQYNNEPNMDLHQKMWPITTLALKREQAKLTPGEQLKSSGGSFPNYDLGMAEYVKLEDYPRNPGVGVGPDLPVLYDVSDELEKNENMGSSGLQVIDRR